MPDYDYEPPFEVGYPDPGPITPVPIDINPPPFENDYPDPGPITPVPIEPTLPGGGDESGIWGALAKLFGGSGGSSLLKSLGMVKSDGSLDLTSLLALAGLFGGTAYGIDQRKEGAEDIKNAGKEANDRIQGALDRANEGYAPYTAAGAGALQKWADMGPQTLADKFHAQGTQSNLASKYKPLSSLVKG